jgi:hypothetical protein
MRAIIKYSPGEAQLNNVKYNPSSVVQMVPGLGAIAELLKVAVSKWTNT